MKYVDFQDFCVMSSSFILESILCYLVCLLNSFRWNVKVNYKSVVAVIVVLPLFFNVVIKNL